MAEISRGLCATFRGIKERLSDIVSPGHNPSWVGSPQVRLSRLLLPLLVETEPSRSGDIATQGYISPPEGSYKGNHDPGDLEIMGLC
jgi:hypothetical protein